MPHDERNWDADLETFKRHGNEPTFLDFGPGKEIMDYYLAEAAEYDIESNSSGVLGALAVWIRVKSLAENIHTNHAASILAGAEANLKVINEAYVYPAIARSEARRTMSLAFTKLGANEDDPPVLELPYQPSLGDGPV